MSECVVRMEMPERCVDCPLHEFGGICRLSCDFKQIDVMVINKGRPDNCPIICQLPEGHGRLVDAEELKQHVRNVVREIIDNQPTIVPAERSET